MTKENDPRRPGSGKIRLGDKKDYTNSGNRAPGQSKSAGEWLQNHTGSIIGVTLGLGVIAGLGNYAVLPLVKDWRETSAVNAANIAAKHKIGAPTSDLIVTSRIDDEGNIVKGADEDFAIQVSVYKQGKLKVWITKGQYAGTEIDVYPANPDQTPGGVVAFTKFADLKSEAGRDHFVPRAEFDAQTVTYPLKGETLAGALFARMPFVVPDYKDVVQKVSSGNNGTAAFAFALNADPKNMSRFSIRMWNNDLYAFDLSKNAYYIKSTYLNTPTWKVGETQRRALAQGDANTVFDVAPAAQPN